MAEKIKERTLSYSVTNWTLQIMTECREESVMDLMKAPGGRENLWFIPFDFKGRSCFKIFWGQYESRREGEVASETLPGKITEGTGLPILIPLSKVL